jgi:hypothetical protein
VAVYVLLDSNGQVTSQVIIWASELRLRSFGWGEYPVKPHF